MRSPKPVLALLHGWGMNARVFDTLADLLRDRFDVRALDLPGHGGRTPLAANTLQTWAADFVQQLPAEAIVLGWSLGGQVAMQAALDHPAKIARVILLASTPRFVAEADWKHAMDGSDLEAFGAALLADPAATLLRFLSLQTRGMSGQKALLQQLRQALLAAPAAHGEALAAGLSILHATDLRSTLPQLAQPTLVVHGTLDTLTPPAAGQWLARTLPHVRHVELPRAAHAPHLSHAHEVAAAIGDFVHG